jgi:hypothetical protein
MKHLVPAGLILVALAALPEFANRSAIAHDPPVPRFGDVSGQVEIVRGIPLTSEFGQFSVFVDETPNSTPCAEDGRFNLRRVPSGSRSLIVVAPEGMSWALGSRHSHRKPVAIVGGQVTDGGTLVMAMPGSVSGRITMTGEPVSDIASVVVAMPQFGLVTKPNTDGGYLLQGVPPGHHELQLQFPNRAQDARDVVSRRARTAAVIAGHPTLGVDFVLEGRRPVRPVEPGSDALVEAGPASGSNVTLPGGASDPGPGAARPASPKEDPADRPGHAAKDLVEVPDVGKMTLKEADSVLREAGFVMAVGPRAAGSAAPWFVTGQLPAAHALVARGSTVTVQVTARQK